MKPWQIYALIDPRTQEVRYVGCTTNMRLRFRKHLAVKDGTPRARWIQELLELGLKPTPDILESGTGNNQAAEKRWIALYRQSGILTNTTDGGDGTVGYVFTPEARQKISAASKGKRHTESWIANSAAAHRALGRKLLSEQKESLRVFHTGRSFITEAGRKRIGEAKRNRIVTAETRIKTSILHKGRTVSTETREKLAQANRGKRHSPESKAKMSATQKGRMFSAEHRAKLAKAATNRKHSQETINLLSEQRRGRKKSPEFVQHMFEARKGKPWNEKRRLAYRLKFPDRTLESKEAA